MSLLGIDIGSSSCKGVVFDHSGKELARESQSYFTINAGPSMVEMDATTFRDAAFSIIQKLSAQVVNDPIEALAISSHGETTILVDKSGNPTGHAIMNSDNRATEEIAWWEETFGRERIYQISGVPLHTMFSLNKMMWLRKHKPEVFEKTDRFLSVGDYILVQLGLPHYTDYSLASRTMAFDINKRCWSEEILRHCGIPKEKLGIPVPSGTLAGRLSNKMASQLGLKAGVAVALGGHDQPCGALGAGAIHAGDVSDSAGTYECMAAVSDRPMNSPKALAYSLNSYCHVVPNKFVTLAFFPAGVVSNWYVTQFCGEDKIIAQQEERDFFGMLAENALKHSPGPTGVCVTPHFLGSCTPYWDVRARGVMAGLTPNITRYHLFKAIHEGIASELAINVEALEEVMGSFSSMSICGGNSRLPFTVQLRADLTGKAIRLLQSDEAVCLGAAMLAGISVGIYKDAADAVKQAVRFEKTVFPNVENQAAYKKQMEQYKLVYPAMERYREV